MLPRLSSPRYLTPGCREGGTTIILSTLTPTPGNMAEQRGAPWSSPSLVQSR